MITERQFEMKLFIDDERFPPNDSYEWIIVRSSDAAVEYVIRYGLPDFISFDHDLGGNDTAMKFIHWLVDELIDGKVKIPSDFDFYVHSQNPVGVANIQSYMENILKEFK